MFFIEILKALLLGLVEGITEWLPISSTGHLLLLDGLIDLNVSESFYGVFEVVIQLGAVCAVIEKYRRRLSPFGKGRQERRETFRLWCLTAIGVFPSAAVGLFLDDTIEEIFFRPAVVAAMLLLYGVVFLFIEKLRLKNSGAVKGLSDMTVGKALTVGAFQVLAMIPGTSRSGATMIGGYLCGATPTAATEYSFLLAIPTMAGAGLLRTVKFFAEGGMLTVAESVLLAVGVLTAFLTSRAVVSVLCDLVAKRGFRAFGIYRIILGGILLLYFYVTRG